MLFVIVSCSGQISVDPTVNFKNLADTKIDSLIIKDLINHKMVIYDIPANDSISVVIPLKGEDYPQNDHTAISIYVFKGKYYFATAYGIVDPPFSGVESVFNFFMKNEGLGVFYNGKETKNLAQPRIINKDNLKQDMFYYVNK